MKYSIYKTFYILLFFSLLPKVTNAQMSNVKVCIDPGHGGSDPGALGANGATYPDEADIVLDVSLDMKNLFESIGATVPMTRSSDTYPSLAYRYNFANQQNPDVFVSVHENSFGDTSVNGTETLRQTNSNSSISSLAQKVQDKMVIDMGFNDRGVKLRGDLAILNGTNSSIPTIITEGCFISNQTAWNHITQESNKQCHANAIKNGILDFLNYDYLISSNCSGGGTTVSPPNLIAPSNNQNNVSIPINFDWSTVSEADAYRICVATSSSGFDPNVTPMFPNSVVNIAGTGSFTSYNWSSAQPNTTYYWAVRANHPSNGTATTQVYSFTTAGSSSTSCTSDSAEPNDSSGTAEYLGSGSSYTETNLCITAGDDDFFRVYANGQYYYFKIRGYNSNTTGEYSLSYSRTSTTMTIETSAYNSSSTDTYLHLYDSNGSTELASNDDGGSGNFSKIIYTLSSAEDIYLTNVSVSDNTLNCEDNITVYATQNYSGSQLDTNLPSFDLDYYLSTNTTLGSTDILLGGDISSLGSDDPSHSESGTYSLPANISGSYYILFVADADGELSESDESNNVGYISIQVSCTIPDDIYLSNLSLSDYTLDCGDVFTAYATQNYSGSQLDTNLPSFDLDYYLSTNTTFGSTDIFLGGDISSLGSDDQSHSESQNLTLPSDLSSGTYYIIFVADADGELVEDNESNNTYYISIQVSCTIPDDIYLSNLSLSDYTLDCGDVFTAYATQNYSGSQLDTNLPSFDLDYYLSTNTTFGSTDIFLGGDISSLGSDDQSHSESQNLTLPSDLSSGTYYIIFVADADGELVEDDESNNTYYISIQVSCTIPEDLYTSNHSISDTTPSCGQTITASCDYNYSGGQTNAQLPTFDMTYYLSTNTTLDGSDLFMGSDVSPLGSDNTYDAESDSYTLPSGLAPGIYYVLFIADSNSELTESNESNNVSAIAITVSCPEDLYTSNHSISDTTPSCGQTITASCDYNYSGGQTNAQLPTFDMTYYLSTNTTLDGSDLFMGSDVSPLGSDNTYDAESDSYTLPSGLAPGIYYVLFIADSNSELTESNESNNVSAIAITVSCNYSITTIANPTNGGTTIGNGSYAYGSTRTVTATPNTGWTFSNWTVNGTIVSTSTSYSFVLTDNITITANFIENIVPCLIPTNVLIEMTSPTAAFASWDAVAGADFYQIWYKQQGTSTWEIKGTAATQRNIPDLIPYQYYQYKVRARCAGNTWSDFSEIETIYSNTCDIVTNIAVEMTSSTSASVSWDAVAGADNYQVWYKQQGTSSWDIKGTTGTQRNIPDLTPNKYYLYKVRAKCAGDIWSDFSEIITLYSDFCEIPAGITAEMTSPTNASISWDAIPGANYYQVRYRLKGTSTWTIKGTAATQKNISNLIPNKYYQYKLRAKCASDLWSDFSEIQLLYSSICDVPTGVSSIYLDNNRMKIRWDNTTEVKGRVSYREIGTSTWYNQNSQSGNNFVYITGLSPNAQYEYKVRSNCQDTDWSAYSDIYYHNLSSSAREIQEANIVHAPTKIYPNPVQNILNIEFPNSVEGKTRISIMDNLGKEKYGENITLHDFQQSETIDISNLPNGYYFLVVSNDEYTEVLKFMKIK